MTVIICVSDIGWFMPLRNTLRIFESFKFKFQIGISHFSREQNAIKYLMIEIIIFIIIKVAYIRIQSLNLSE